MCTYEFNNVKLPQNRFNDFFLFAPNRDIKIVQNIAT